MSHTWHAVSSRTGNRGPRIVTKQLGIISATIGGIHETVLDALIWDTERNRPVPEWEQWTQPGRIMLVCCDADDEVVWAGDVIRRERADDSLYVTLTLVNSEGYLDRRYMRSTLDAVNMSQDNLARLIVGYSLQSDTIGSPNFWTAGTSGSPYKRDRSYYLSDDKTTYSLLQDLMNVQNGPEFSVMPRWHPTARYHSNLQRMMYIADRVGSFSSPARFEYPGAVTSYRVVEDFSRDNGANDVLASSSGEGDARPESRVIDPVTPELVRYERRITPSTSIIDTNVLFSHAVNELQRVRNGVVDLTLVANLDEAPRYGSDWSLGDDVTVAVSSPAYPARRAADNTLVPGLELRARIVSWTMDLDARKLTPRVRLYT